MQLAQNVPPNSLDACSTVSTVMVSLLKSCLPATPFFQRQIGSRPFLTVLVAWTITSSGFEVRQEKPVGAGVLATASCMMVSQPFCISFSPFPLKSTLRTWLMMYLALSKLMSMRLETKTAVAAGALEMPDTQ